MNNQSSINLICVDLHKKIGNEIVKVYPSTSSFQVWMDEDRKRVLGDILVDSNDNVSFKVPIKGITPDIESNDATLATTQFINNLITKVFSEDDRINSFLQSASDRLDLVSNTVRGKSVLNISSIPTNNNGTAANGFSYNYSIAINTIKNDSMTDDIFVGDMLLQNTGTLYLIGYMDSSNAYLKTVGSIKGATGDQGIQGEQGPQGPKGDPGQGYFIVTDEDYSKIADFVEEKSYHSYQRPNSSEPIRPNIFYDFGPQYNLEITFEAPQSQYRSNEYMFQFESPSDRPTTLVMPADVRWCYDPVIETGKTYQVSVLNNLGVICGA